MTAASNQIVETELRTLLERAGGDYVAAYDKLVSDEQTKAIAKAPRSTLDHRKQVWKNAVAKLDRHLLAKMRRTLSGYMTLVRRNSEITSSEEPKILAPTETHDLMEEFLDLKEIEVFVKARREDIKRSVFGHFTEEAAEAGAEFPEQQNSSIDVPELGHRFAREGCGRKEPELDEYALQDLLGEDQWKQVTDVEVIPAQEIRVLSVEKLMQLARKEPAILEKVRESLLVGEWKTPRFCVRQL